MDEQPEAQEERSRPSKEPPGVHKAEPQSALAEQPATEQQLQKVEREMNAFERSTLRWTKDALRAATPVQRKTKTVEVGGTER